MEDKVNSQMVQYLLTQNVEELKYVMDTMLHCMLSLSKSMRGKTVKHEYDNYANLMFQMILSKAIYLRRNIDTIKIQDGSDYLIYDDPAVVLNIVRQLYEAICIFAIVFCIPETEDKRMILFNVYATTGLRKRSNFDFRNHQEEAEQKLRADREAMDLMLTEIEESEYYSQLDSKNKKALRKFYDGYDFAPFVLFDDFQLSDKVKFEDIPKYLDIKETITQDVYRYLCTHAHSSYYSLLQFSQWYEKNGVKCKMYHDVIAIQVKFACMMISVSIDEYIKRFPELHEIKNKFSERERQILDGYNYIARNHKNDMA